MCQCVMGLFGITGNPKHSCNLLCDNGLASTASALPYGAACIEGWERGE